MARRLVLIVVVLVLFFLFIEGFAVLDYTKDYLAKVKSRQNNTGNGISNQFNNDFNSRDKADDSNDIDVTNASSDALNLLVLGLDADRTRSDVIFLANYKPGETRLNILSIARDTKVTVNGKISKINALIGMGGEEAIIAKVEEITGLPVHYYITMDFEGFRKIIDALGGVEIDVPFDMHYDDPVQNLHIHLNKGRQLLDGQKAEQFVRYRKGNSYGEGYPNGDLGRIEAQQMLIKELIKQKFNLRYISKIDDIFAIVEEHTRTNIGLDDIMYYLKNFSVRISEIKTWTIPGTDVIIDDIYYIVHDEEKTREIIDEHFYKH